MSENNLSEKEKRELSRQRKEAAKEAQRYHKEKNKKTKKSSEKKSHSKIERAVNERKKKTRKNLTREEKFRIEGEKKIRNLEPKDFEDGYYIDEFGEKQRQERRARDIRKQETEVIHRHKKPVTQQQLGRRRVMIYSAIFLVVLLIGVILSLTVLFKTEKIEIEGGDNYYDDQIIAFSNVSLQQNIFLAVLGSTPEKIEENLTYVEKADISFAIPDMVVIKITDAIPSYVIKTEKGFLIVSSKGRILDLESDNKDKLPELICGELKSREIGDYISFSDDNVPDILQKVSESLIKNKVEKITGFDVSDSSKISLVYDNRISIKIGLPEDIDYKIRTAMAIINDKLDPNNAGTIAGTLDVSNCNTGRISRYIPPDTTAEVQETTAEPTAPTESATYSDGYYDSGEGYYSDGGEGYDSGYDYNDNQWSDYGSDDDWYAEPDNDYDWQSDDYQDSGDGGYYGADGEQSW